MEKGLQSIVSHSTPNYPTGKLLKDNLDWDYHVSELKGWHSPTAKKFGINSIPSNFLIDGDGIILAKNLRGSKLEIVLQHYLKN